MFKFRDRLALLMHTVDVLSAEPSGRGFMRTFHIARTNEMRLPDDLLTGC